MPTSQENICCQNIKEVVNQLERHSCMTNHPGFSSNGEPAVLVHHGIVRRCRCGSLVTQRPLP